MLCCGPVTFRRQRIDILAITLELELTILEAAVRAPETALETLIDVAAAHQVEQLGMTDRHVIALVIDIDHGLPVEIEAVVIAAAETLHVLDAVQADLFLRRRQRLRHGRTIAAEANENQAMPDFAVQRLESILAAIEVREGIGPWNIPQAAVEVVGPAVKRADKGLAAMTAFLGDHARCAMPTNVVEGANLSFAVAHHDGAFVAHTKALVIAAVGELGDMPDKQPVTQKHLFDFEAGQFRVVISPGR